MSVALIRHFLIPIMAPMGVVFNMFTTMYMRIMRITPP